MKATKTLLAASVVSALVVAGSADAATVQTYNVGAAITQIIFHFPQATDTVTGVVTPAHDGDILANGGVTNAGTAVLDDSGTLSITGAVIHALSTFGTETVQTLNASFTGTWNGTSFAPVSGNFYYTACQDLTALLACGSANAALNTTFAYASVSGAAAVAGGTVGGVNSVSTSNSSYAFTLTPAVPVPAAMWLFGSGLLGLAGTARRRRAV